MRKALILFSLLCLVAAGAVQGQDYWNPPTLANRNASGFDYYMLEVPNSALPNMVADGFDNDWAWFDPEYILTIDEWRDEGERTLPSRADLDITTKMAWKGAPENRVYVFMAAHDDTLSHEGTTPSRWDGDMIGFNVDPQDHGRTRGASPCYDQEWVAAPGNVTPGNFAYRYPEGEGQPGQLAWQVYGQPPWMYSAVRVVPQEAWAADSWTSDTGGDTYYEWNVKIVNLLEDGGPAVSQERDLNAQSGEGGFGLPFVFFYEDGDPGFANDMTTRGAEGSARQYFSHATLLKVGEYATAVEGTTWGRIKSSF